MKPLSQMSLSEKWYLRDRMIAAAPEREAEIRKLLLSHILLMFGFDIALFLLVVLYVVVICASASGVIWLATR